VPQPDDCFVSLGGDSLNYVALSIEVEECLGTLPNNWEELTFAELQARIPNRDADTGGMWRWVDSEIVLRALAIMAVVVNHVSQLVVGGGAQVLILLAGYNLARYQRKRLFNGEGWGLLASFVQRVILPYYVILIAYFVWKRRFDWPSLLLVSNFVGRTGSMLEPFWFLEALLQCMTLVVILMAIRPIRIWGERDPWRFGLVLLACSVAMKVLAASAFAMAHLLNRTVDAVFYVLAFGWCVQQANTVPRRCLLSGLAVAFAGLSVWGPPLWPSVPPPSNVSQAVWMLVASLLILWAPRIRIPSVLHWPVTTIAAASFYIYLSHVLPVGIIFWGLKIKSLSINLVAALAVGVGTWLLVQRFDPRGRAAQG
jgi:hypothetical protein